MGKPKALRSSAPSQVVIDKAPSNRKKKFSEEDDFQQDAGETSTDALSKVADVVDQESDLPEEVAADNNEIMRLRELHEKLVENTAQKSKRRKAVSNKQSSLSADAELDASVLDALPDDEEDCNHEEEDDEDEDDLHTSWKIDVQKTNSRKIGGIEVAVLDQDATIDPIKSFSVSDSVAKFTATAYSKNPRVKYSTFVSQKKGGPAKQFTVKA